MTTPVYRYEQIDSTQLEAWRLVEKSTPYPFFVTAENQTDGKGRRGRQWSSESDRSFCFSLALKLDGTHPSALSLLVGLSLCESLKDERVKIKWPNDLILNDQKIGGVLMESRSQGSSSIVVIGVGINFFDLVSQPYKGLGRSIDKDLFFSDFFRIFSRHYEFGFEASREAFETRLWKLNESVQFQVQNETIRADLQGVDSLGRLCLRSGEKLRLEWDGELLLE